jgi:hypothetical protein
LEQRLATLVYLRSLSCSKDISGYSDFRSQGVAYDPEVTYFLSKVLLSFSKTHNLELRLATDDHRCKIKALLDADLFYLERQRLWISYLFLILTVEMVC